jgi:hypothetical protein
MTKDERIDELEVLVDKMTWAIARLQGTDPDVVRVEFGMPLQHDGPTTSLASRP